MSENSCFALNRTVPIYDQVGFIYAEVAFRLLERLGCFKISPQTVLDLGCGVGVDTLGLSRRFPQARILAVDIAIDMLKVAKHKDPRRWWQKKRRCSWINAGAEALPLETGSVDCVWSNLYVQWLDVPDLVYRELVRVLSPGGVFLFSSLGPDTFKELRWALNQIVPPPRTHPFLDMHDLGDALLQEGLSDPVMEMETITVMYPNIQTLIKDIHVMGGCHGIGEHPQLQHICDRYETLRTPAGLPLTYEIVYGHAWQKHIQTVRNTSYQPIRWF